MAWTFISNRGTNTTKTSGLTLGVSPTATIAAGRILVVRCTSDDTTGSGPTHAVSDTAGNTYEQLVFSSGSSDAAATTVSIHISRLTTQLTTGSTVTLTLGATRNTKVIELTEFSVATGFTYALAGSNSAGGSGTTPSVAISGLSLIARLWIGLVGAEGLNGDTFTEDADYSNTITIGTTGNPTASNIKASGGNRIATQTGDTYNPTITSRDWRTALVALTETAIPAANFEASVSGTGTGTAALTTSITMTASVSGIATATGDLTLASILLEASITGQANAVGRLTLPNEENYSAASDYLEVQWVKHIFRTGSFTKPTALYISLHTEPLDDDATGAEVTGGSYARAQLDPGDANWTAVGAGGTNALTSNAVAVAFPAPTANWGQIVGFGIWDAATTGNLLFHGALDQYVTISSGAPAPVINPGGLQVNLDVPPLTASIPLSASITGTATATATGLSTIYFADDFEGNNMVAKWAGDGEGGVWWDYYDFHWHSSTTRPRTGTYSAQCHYSLSTGVSSPHGTPVLGTAAGGGPAGSRTYYVKIVYVRPAFQEEGGTDHTYNLYYSNETSQVVGSGDRLTVASPTGGEGFYYYMIYAGTSSGDINLKLQNSSTTAISYGTDWTEPAGGLVNLADFPASWVPDGTSMTRQFWRNLDYAPFDTNGAEHVFSRGYVYIQSPNGSASKAFQRKLMRHNAITGWTVSLSSFYDSGTDRIRLQVTINNTTGCGSYNQTPIQPTATTAITFDAWHCIELETLLNTPSQSNGEVRLYIDGLQKGEVTGVPIRGACTTGVQIVYFGDQLDNTPGGVLGDEYRFWDDIIIADLPIGL